MPVVLVPDRRPPLQNKAQDVVLGTYAVPDEEGDRVVLSLSYIVPFVGSQVVEACTHPVMQAFLFRLEEVDNVQGLLSFRSMFQLISFLRLGRCLCLISANGRFSSNILPGNSDGRIDITQVHNIVVAF